MTFCSMSWTLAVYMKGLWIVVVFLHIGVKGTLELDHNGAITMVVNTPQRSDSARNRFSFDLRQRRSTLADNVPYQLPR